MANSVFNVDIELRALNIDSNRFDVFFDNISDEKARQIWSKISPQIVALYEEYNRVAGHTLVEKNYNLFESEKAQEIYQGLMETVVLFSVEGADQKTDHYNICHFFDDRTKISIYPVSQEKAHAISDLIKKANGERTESCGCVMF